MHILIVPSWYSNVRSVGSGSFFRDQALALAGAGHKVGVLAQKIWGMRDYRTGPMPEMNKISVEDDGPLRVYRRDAIHRLPRVPFRDALAHRNNGLLIFNAYETQEGRPDVIHAHGALHGGVVAAAIKRRSGIPYALTEHSSDYDEHKHRWWQKRLVAGVLRSANARLAVSPSLARQISKQFPKMGQPIDVIPNLLPPAFEMIPPDQINAAMVPKAHPSFVFLCVARISAEKNQIGLIQAFAEAFPGRNDVELHFVGPGDGQSLLDQAEHLQIGGKVQVYGTKVAEQVRRHMIKSDCLVLASFVETFGVVLIESLAVGTPVIATACGGPESIVTPENGILIPPRDHPALVEALVEMHANFGRYDAKTLRRDCLAHYGTEAIVGRLVDIYATIRSGKNDNEEKRQPNA